MNLVRLAYFCKTTFNKKIFLMSYLTFKSPQRFYKFQRILEHSLEKASSEANPKKFIDRKGKCISNINLTTRISTHF